MKTFTVNKLRFLNHIWTSVDTYNYSTLGNAQTQFAALTAKYAKDPSVKISITATDDLFNSLVKQAINFTSLSDFINHLEWQDWMKDFIRLDKDRANDQYELSESEIQSINDYIADAYTEAHSTERV